MYSYCNKSIKPLLDKIYNNFLLLSSQVQILNSILTKNSQIYIVMNFKHVCLVIMYVVMHYSLSAYEYLYYNC